MPKIDRECSKSNRGVSLELHAAAVHVLPACPPRSGSAPANRAEHLGTTPNNLERSGGLASGLGGFAVHSLLFAGPEVMAEVSSGGNSLVLQEVYSSSSPTNWVSHPTGIGYRRPAPANGGLPANSGNAPITDSGTTDGSNDQELARLTNFDTGGNENPTATQTAPTSRAEQQGGVATATGTGPPGEGPDGGDGGYYDDGGQWRPIGGDGGGDGKEDGDGEDGGDGLAPDGYPYPIIVPLNQEPLAATPYTGPFENPREDPNVPSPGDPGPQDSGPPTANPAPGSQTPPPQSGQAGEATTALPGLSWHLGFSFQILAAQFRKPILASRRRRPLYRLRKLPG